MLKRIGLSSRAARSSASGPHGYQSTGLWACCSRYGLVSLARRLVWRGASTELIVLRYGSGPRRATPERSQRDFLRPACAAQNHEVLGARFLAENVARRQV